MNAAEGPLQRRPPPPFPFTVLTGFLGAGKTTLLNRLLHDPALADTLVLINEFGDAGLDHLLAEPVNGDTVLMASGCVCCAIRGEFVQTLEEVLRRRDNGRIAPFSRVILETTGLADPAPVLHTIMSHPYLRLRFNLHGVITLVDAVNGRDILDEFPEAIKQVVVADRIVLSKTDLCDGAQARERLAWLIERLHGLNPIARMLDAARGEAVAGRLLDAGPYDAEALSPRARALLKAEAFGAAIDAARVMSSPNAHRSDGGVRSVVLRAPAPMTPANLRLFLDMASQLHGASLLRLKGIVSLDDDPGRPLVVHAVQHVLHPPVRLQAWPEGVSETFIVCILRDLDPGHLEGLWRAFSGQPAVDAPDAAAVSANPLAPRSGGLFNHS